MEVVLTVLVVVLIVASAIIVAGTELIDAAIKAILDTLFGG